MSNQHNNYQRDGAIADNTDRMLGALRKGMRETKGLTPGQVVQVACPTTTKKTYPPREETTGWKAFMEKITKAFSQDR